MSDPDGMSGVFVTVLIANGILAAAILAVVLFDV